MNEERKNNPLYVGIEDGQLIISIGIDTLAFASSWKNGGPVENLEIKKGGEIKWAKSIVEEMLWDNTLDDPRPITKFLDEMIEKTWESIEES